MDNSATPLPTNIDGVTGSVKIADLWRNHYKDLLNCVNYRYSISCQYDLSTKHDDILVSQEEIENATKQLDCNKSCGLDGIYAEHLK